MRLRPGMTYAVGLWITFALADWVADRFIHPGSLSWLWGVRGATLPILMAGLIRLYWKPEPSPRATTVLVFIMFSAAAVGLSLMCIGFEGLRSLYFGGLLVAIACRGALVAEPWRAGLPAYILMVASYPAALFGSMPFSDATRVQLEQPDALAAFAIQAAFLAGTSGLTLLAGHAYWAMRRQVFESRSIGRYRLKTKLGAGGMGEVWSAYHSGLRRDVALKLLRAEDGLDTSSVQRFEREVQAMTELSHPNTVRVFDYGVTEDGIWYYAMELLDGVDLGRLLESSGPLEPARALYLLSQASRALSEAHERGIFHRDIKPENLFVTRAGGQRDFLKVLDFGIAKVSAEKDSTLTQAGSVVGTPMYMSPEVVTGKGADARADVYALGAVAYYMLAGSPPFESDNAAAVLLAHAQVEPTPPSLRIGHDLPKDLEQIVMRCLKKEPEDRYVDAAALADALRECEDAGRWDPAQAPFLPTELADAPRLADPEAETAAAVLETTEGS